MNWLYKYSLILGDNSMMLAHRLSELCSHGPNLETDIALTNISLDLFGQVRSCFQYAATLDEADTNEDKIAFGRNKNEYYNCLLTEQPNTDFGYVIARQFLFDAWHLPYLAELAGSTDKNIAAIAAKSIKESRYHIRFSSGWMNRLGDGTEESNRRLQAGFDHMYPFVPELFSLTKEEDIALEHGVCPNPAIIGESFEKKVAEVCQSSGIIVPEITTLSQSGKEGQHGELLDEILEDLQFMMKKYPEHQW